MWQKRDEPASPSNYDRISRTTRDGSTPVNRMARPGTRTDGAPDPAQQVQDGGVQVANVHRVVHRVVAQLVRRPGGRAAFHAAAGEQFLARTAQELKPHHRRWRQSGQVQAKAPRHRDPPRQSPPSRLHEPGT
jgi:hypothetical protein